jgi:hypothetical protein
MKLNSFIRKSLCLSISIFSFGCSTQTASNQQAELINKKLAENHEIYKACFKNIESTPDALYVKKNILMVGKEADNKISLLSSTKTLSEADKKILLVRLGQIYDCNKVSLQSLSNIYIPYANAMSANMQRNDIVFAKLISGSMNVGEANQALLSNETLYAKEWEDARTIRNNQIAQAHYSELQDRNAKTIILQNMLNSMYLPNSSSITTCTPIGGTINCMSR